MNEDRRRFVVGLGATSLAAAAVPVFGLVQLSGGKLLAIRQDDGVFRDRHFVLREGEQVSLAGMRGVKLHNCRFTWIGMQPDQCLDLRQSRDCSVIGCDFEGERMNFRIERAVN